VRGGRPCRQHTRRRRGGQRKEWGRE
jgi:hypothetical protein